MERSKEDFLNIYMQLFHSFIISLLFGVLFLFPSFAYAEEHNVAFDRSFIPIEFDNSYIEVALWYPTADSVRNQEIGEDGRYYSVALAGTPLQTENEQNLILLSLPTFAHNHTYSTLSHVLAQNGFVVATITHNGDWAQDMRYSFSAVQFPLRALHIKSTIEYVLNDTRFIVDSRNISVLSFYETAMAPLITYGLPINQTNYNAFCERNPSNVACVLPLSTQLTRMYDDIVFFEDYLERAEEFYLIESERILLKNTEIENAWQIAVDEANEFNEPLPPSPIFLDELEAPKDIDAFYPIVKNFIMIEPSLSFLLNSQESAYFDFNIYAMYSLGKMSSILGEEYNELEARYPVQTFELNISDTSALTDICTSSELNDFTSICARIPQEDQQVVLQEFMEKIKTIIYGV